ncbi:MAG: hypothetical protein AAGC73_00745 [Verrucomicrobiota bacterium]
MEDVNTLIGSYDKRRQLEERSQIAASLNLIPEAVEMFQTLKEKRKETTSEKRYICASSGTAFKPPLRKLVDQRATLRSLKPRLYAE